METQKIAAATGVITITFSMDLEVHDAAALYKAAVEHARDKDNLDEDLILEILGSEEAPDVEACVQMLLDPGSSPPGLQIQGSFCGAAAY